MWQSVRRVPIATTKLKIKGKTKMNMKKGFTLIEIMIVVAIIAILAAVAIPNFISYRKTSQMNACIANQEQIRTACEAYYIKNGSYPTTVAMLTDVAKGGFMKTEPKCGGASYTITAPTATDPQVKVECGNTDKDPNYPHAKATGTAETPATT